MALINNNRQDWYEIFYSNYSIEALYEELNRIEKELAILLPSTLPLRSFREESIEYLKIEIRNRKINKLGI